MGVQTRFPFTWMALKDSCQSLHNPAVNYGLVLDFPCPFGECLLESNESPLAEGAACPLRVAISNNEKLRTRWSLSETIHLAGYLYSAARRKKVEWKENKSLMADVSLMRRKWRRWPERCGSTGRANGRQLTGMAARNFFSPSECSRSFFPFQWRLFQVKRKCLLWCKMEFPLLFSINSLNILLIFPFADMVSRPKLFNRRRVEKLKEIT